MCQREAGVEEWGKRLNDHALGRELEDDVSASIRTISENSVAQEGRLERLSETLDGVVGALELLRDEPGVAIGDELAEFERIRGVLDEAAGTARAIHTAATDVESVTREQAEQLDEVSDRADQLERYARPLGDILGRFETAAEHEFVFSGGPSQPMDASDD